MKAPLQGSYCVCGDGCQCDGVGLTCVAARPIHIDTASFCIARNIRRQRLQNAETDRATSIRLASLSVSCRATEVKKAWLQHSSSHKVSGAVPSEPRVGTTTTSKQFTDKMLFQNEVLSTIVNIWRPVEHRRCKIPFRPSTFDSRI